MTKRWLLFGSVVLALAGCAGDVVGEADALGADELGTGDVGSSEAELLGAPPIPAEVIRRIARHHRLTQAELDEVFTLHHYVRIGHGREVHATETFTVRSWLRWPHRGAILLPGTISVGSSYNLDVDGYRFTETLAQRGFFVFAIDYEGSGESSYPENGRDVTHEFLVDEARRVVEYIRWSRLVPRVDAYGEIGGGAVATELCHDRTRMRSCVLSSMLYREGTPFFQAVFLDPAFLAFLQSPPDGYLEVGPELYFNVIARTEPAVANAILATQPGIYPTGPFFEPTSLPWFDPTRAQVPALIIQGTEDNIATQADAEELAADWGSHPRARGEATLVRIEGAGHVPRIEPSPIHEQWEAAVLDFLDP